MFTQVIVLALFPVLSKLASADKFLTGSVVGLDSTKKTISYLRGFPNAVSRADTVTIRLPTFLTSGHVGERIIFGRIGESSVEGTIDSVYSFGKNSFVWSGSVGNGGTFYLSYFAGSIVAYIYFLEQDVQYVYRPFDQAAGLYTLEKEAMSTYDRESDDEAHSLLEAPLAPLVSGSSITEVLQTKHKNALLLSTDTNNILDVMVIYTPQALAAYGDDVNTIEALIDLTISMSNDAYRNSGIDMRMRLVLGTMVADPNFVESSFTTDLSRLRSTTDGFLDEDMALRDEIGADAVVLITSQYQYCGIGYLWANSAYAVSLISVHCPQSLAHEIGHNVGAHHDREAAGNAGSSTSAYNFGWCWDTGPNTCKRSVMAYSSCDTPSGQTHCPRDFWFSNPDVTQGVLNQPTGTATSNNARVHNEQISRVINWKPSLHNQEGLLFAVEPDTSPIDICTVVNITGWRIGNGDDITSVTLDGVEVNSILAQGRNHVSVRANLKRSQSIDHGHVVVTTSSGIVSTLEGVFSYTAASGVESAASGCNSNHITPTQIPTASPTSEDSISMTVPSSAPSSVASTVSPTSVTSHGTPSASPTMTVPTPAPTAGDPELPTPSPSSKFDWMSYYNSNVGSVAHYNSYKRTRIAGQGGSTSCRILTPVNKTGKKWYVEPVDGVIASGHPIMNGYVKLKVPKKPLVSGGASIQLAFGIGDEVAMTSDTFRWTQNILENSHLLKFKHLSDFNGSVQDDELEVMWQLDFTAPMVDSQGNSHTFPVGDNFYVEMMVIQRDKSRMCVRVEGLSQVVAPS